MKEMKLEINGKEYEVVIEEFGVSKAVLTVDGEKYEVNLKDLGIEKASESANINIGGAMMAPQAAMAQPQAASVAVATDTSAPTAPAAAAGGSGNTINAPLPGLIMKILVKEGDEIKSGQNIAVMEAMKMENHVPSTVNGKVKKILVKEGDSVAEGAPLMELE